MDSSIIINDDDEPQVEEDQLINYTSSSSMVETSTSLVSRSTTNHFVMGKHRMAAAISSLDQQIQFIQVFLIMFFLNIFLFFRLFRKVGFIRF